MKICYGVMAQITHFRFLRISPLIFATVQKFALDYLRDQQILIPTCEWGLAVVVPLLGETLEVDDLPGMVCGGIRREESIGYLCKQIWSAGVQAKKPRILF